MVTQTNSVSPFIDNTNNIPKDLPVSTAEDFSIRTMHDDLLSLQKESKPLENIMELKKPQPTTETKKVITPITSSQIPVSKNVSINKPPFDDTKKQGSTDFVEIPIAEKAGPNFNMLYKVLLGAVVFFIVVIVGLGGYYYFFLKNKSIVQAPIENPVLPPVEPPVETPIITPIAEKYSLDTPNYLSFDPAKETLDDLNKKFVSIADELKNKDPQSIYEFSVVDSNNNPVVLSIFAAATKLNLSSKLLENLGETFSIFFYNDDGNIRLAIATTIKDKSIVTNEMLKQEATLVSDTAFLFIEPVPEKKPVKFSTSDYNRIPVRYFNFSFVPPFSIDYIIKDSNLIIGTSKNTARAVFDKLLEKNSTTNTTSETTETSSMTGASPGESPVATTPAPIAPQTPETNQLPDVSTQK